MRHFFFESLTADLAVLSYEDSHHALRVLRMKTGDVATLVCGTGFIYGGELLSEQAPARFRIISKQAAPMPKYHIHLHMPQLVPKKLEPIVRAAVELWAHEVFITRTDNSEKTPLNPARLQKIARSATLQSGLYYEPTIHAPTELSAADFSRLSFYACPNTKSHVRSVLDTYTPQDINLFTGPESGFSDDEKNFFASKAVIAVNLTPGVLRAETAPIAAISAVRALWA